MSGRLEVRPVAAYRLPGYPGIPAPREFAARRYGPTVLDRIRRGLARPLVVFGLWASLQLAPARADDDPPAVQGPREDGAGEEPRVKTLTRAEIEHLVCGIEIAREQTGDAIAGKVAGQMGYITEDEGRQLLEALFAKNGYRLARDVTIRDRFVEFAADGYDETRRAGFEYLGPENPGAWEFQPLEKDLEAAEKDEIAFERARRDRAIQVVDGANYAYNVEYMNHLPSKAQAVDRLLEDVRRFLVWLGEEGGK